MHFIIVGQVVQAICEASTSFPLNPNWGDSSGSQLSDTLLSHLNGTRDSDTANQLNAWHFSMMVFVCILLFVLFCFVLFSEQRKKCVKWDSNIVLFWVFFPLRLSLMMNYWYFPQNIPIFFHLPFCRRWALWPKRKNIVTLFLALCTEITFPICCLIFLRGDQNC